MSRNNRTSGQGQNPGLGRIVEGKTYIGFVKNNMDSMKMGRLQVWIPEMGGSATDSSTWHTVGYASPFGGSTPVSETEVNSQSMEGTQTSYGWWAVPPDLDNQVLCTFVNGEANKGYWFACIWQQNMNHMVPGLASNKSFQPGGSGILPPVTEYNKNQNGSGLDPRDPVRPRFNPLHDGLVSQGLYTDFERGPTSASARREMPAKVYGMLSPRGNQMYVDDDSDNSYIRMRTRNGAQVLIHDTTGYVYINSAKGNSWIEISDDGIDMYTSESCSVRAEKDLNFRADRDIHLDAGRDITVRAGNNIQNKAGADIHNAAGANYMTKAGAAIGEKSPTIYNSADAHHTKAGKILRDGLIRDNCGEAASSPEATDAAGVARKPTHEPWPLHPKTEKDAPQGETPLAPSFPSPHPSAGASGGTANVTSGAVSSTGAVNAPTPTIPQKTGDGKRIQVEAITDASKKIKVSTATVSERVNEAILAASEKSGVDYGYMMAMAEQESTFNPNAKASTSSASGLYQFTDGTWKGMVANYPNHGFKLSDKSSPEAQAIMAAEYANENKKLIEKATGRKATNTDLYLGHFLGGGGAKRFLTTDGSALATTATSEASANANASIFYKDPKTKLQPRTVDEVYQLFAKKIEPKASAYTAAKASTTTA